MGNGVLTLFYSRVMQNTATENHRFFRGCSPNSSNSFNPSTPAPRSRRDRRFGRRTKSAYKCLGRGVEGMGTDYVQSLDAEASADSSSLIAPKIACTAVAADHTASG